MREPLTKVELKQALENFQSEMTDRLTVILALMLALGFAAMALFAALSR